MPTYDYFCPANGQTLEVLHSFSKEVKTWGDLCELADVAAGDTARDTPVERAVTAGNFISSTSSTAPQSRPAPPMGGGCCGGGGCGC